MKKYIVFDLEATCWENAFQDRQQEMETIEIGAVLVDEQFRVLDQFQTFVKPFVHPLLGEFCKSLTSIRQDQVDNAPSFAEAFPRFLAWGKTAVEQEQQTSSAVSFSPIFASWGNYDYEQLERDCARLNMTMFAKDLHLNAKDMYKNYTGKKGRGLGLELKRQNLSFDGVAHRGIDDARMVAKLLQHVSQTFADAKQE